MPDYLQELFPAEPALMAELLHLFLDDATASMHALTEQMRLADVVATGKTLHTLNGSCSQMGGHVMGQILEEMQQRLRERGIEPTRELLPALQVAFQALIAAMHDWMLKVACCPPRG